MRRRNASLLALLGLVAALALSACGDSDSDSTGSTSAATTEAEAPPSNEKEVVAPQRPDGADDVELELVVKAVGTATGFEFEDGKVTGTMGKGTAEGEVSLAGSVGKTTMTMTFPGGTASYESTGNPREDGSIAGEWAFTEGTGDYEGIEGGGDFVSQGATIDLVGWLKD